MAPSRGCKLDQEFPKKKIDGKWRCRWCGKELSGRKTSWCGESCADEALIRCWPTHARYLVARRDHGICALCGIDTEKLRERLIRLRRRWGLDIANKVLWKYVKQGWPMYIWRSWWEADHVIPVSRGGGQCGLDGYRTLCVPCHKKETAKLRRKNE